MQPPLLVSERLLRILPTTQGFTQQDPPHNFSHSYTAHREVMTQTLQ